MKIVNMVGAGKMIFVLFFLSISGCTFKAVGDPNRPITIQAHITIDINGLQDTAKGIEDYVSGEISKPEVRK